MDNKNVAANILWNTLGNIFYLGCQWLLSVVVVRISGSYADAGVLTLAVSVTNIFATFAAFSVRNYQVSDVDGTYTQSDYISHRVLTCSAALILCTIFVVIGGYSWGTALSIIAYMLMKTVEAFADVFHGILQKQWRLDIVGRSCIYRGVILLVSFTAVYKLTGKLSTALLVMAALTAIMFLLYDFQVVNKLTKLSCRFNVSSLLSLSRNCLPVLGYSIFFNSIVLIARFFIERYHGEEMLGYYGSVSTIAVIIQTAAGIILTSLNGVISDYYVHGEEHRILGLSQKVLLLLAVITGVALIEAAVLGKFVLVLLFGVSIAPYSHLIYPTIIASCLTALVCFLGMMLIIMRTIRPLIMGAALGFLISMVLSILLIPIYVFGGANIAIIVAIAVTVLIYAFAVAKKLQTLH